MVPLRAFKRRHFKSSGGFGDNVWWLGGGWCKPRVPPKIAKIRLRIIRVCRINGVIIRMGRLKSPYDPSLDITNLRAYARSLKGQELALVAAASHMHPFWRSLHPHWSCACARVCPLGQQWNRKDCWQQVLVVAQGERPIQASRAPEARPIKGFNTVMMTMLGP